MSGPLNPLRRVSRVAEGDGVPVVTVDLDAAAAVAQAWGGGIPVARLDLRREDGTELIVHVLLERADDDAPIFVAKGIGKSRDIVRRFKVRTWDRSSKP